MRITLPIILNPISRRKDKSVRISLETRELNSEEIMTLMSLEGVEGWICIAPNEAEIEIPDESAVVDVKTPAQRMRSVLYVLYNKDVREAKYVGLFQTYYDEKMERLINLIKEKLD